LLDTTFTQISGSILTLPSLNDTSLHR